MGSVNPPLQKRVRELESGMELAKPVHDRDGSRLFPAGKKLEADDIERLKQWKIRRVYVKA